MNFTQISHAKTPRRRVRKGNIIAILFLCTALTAGLYAQDFGFGFDDDGGQASAPSGLSAKVGGEIGVQFLGFVHDFSSEKKMHAASLGDVVYGSLNFSASAANVDAFIGLNLSAAAFSGQAGSGSGSPLPTPLILDEAYLRAYFGTVSIEAGLRKLTWGKADSMGPLDVINPLDYTDLTNITDILAMKIARPLARITWDINGFSRLEAVFIPNFAGYRFAQSGSWMPSQFSTIADVTGKEILDQLLHKFPAASAPAVMGMYPHIAESFSDFSPEFPDTSGLKYFQSGLRFTATIGPADIGAQYFCGSLFRPDVTIAGIDAFADDMVAEIIYAGTSPYFGKRALISPQIKYNRYHQIGLDYAQVLFGFNLRGECAVHLTEDLSGKDGSVRNPFIAWSLGFDRGLFAGLTANIQCNETIRLLYSNIGTSPALDCEAGAGVTSTRMTMQLSKKFLKDELECKVTAIWGIEDSDCYIIPAVVWNIRDVTAEFSGGVFAGKESGELGQYRKNSFVKIGLKYSF